MTPRPEPFAVNSETASGLAIVKLDSPRDKKIAGLTAALIDAQRIVYNAGAPADPLLIASVLGALMNPGIESRG